MKTSSSSADAGRVYRGSTTPVARPDGTLVGRIWTLREVTANRRLERLRDAFVAAVSPQLRTPLTSISGFLELLGDQEDGLPLTGRTYLVAARRGTSQQEEIVEDLLLVAQIEADLLELYTEPVDLAELVAVAVEDARATATEKRVAITLDSDGSLPLEADAARLRQVLDNLLSNAIKYTPAGGAISVTATDSKGRGVSRSLTTGSVSHTTSSASCSRASTELQRPPGVPFPAPGSDSSSRARSSRATGATSRSRAGRAKGPVHGDAPA